MRQLETQATASGRPHGWLSRAEGRAHSIAIVAATRVPQQ